VKLASLVADTSLRGQFEKNLKELIDEAKKDPNIILLIDEIHTLMGAGASKEDGLDAANMMKTALEKGEIRCIGATTYDEYRKTIEKDGALSSRFSKIDIAEPSIEGAIQILQGVQSRYASHHGVTYTPGALRAAVELTHRFVNDSHLPRKAFKALDWAGSRESLFKDGNGIVDADKIGDIVAQMARMPRQQVDADEAEKLMTLDDDLKAVVFGQDEAINALSDAIKIARSGLGDPEKPVGSFLFAGPTGVGKTEVAKQLALSLGIHLHRFDMSEYMEPHSVSRLIGAPPGYVGSDKGGLLTEAIIKQPYSVLLLDEIEKAHPQILNTLLQAMDNGTMTDSDGRKADFRNVVIIMTTNAGAAALTKAGIGFTKVDQTIDRKQIINERFTPEFRNRIDAIVHFKPLNDKVIKLVTEKFTGQLKEQLGIKNVTATFTEAALGYLSKKGFDEQMGARPMKRLIQDEIRSVLAKQLLGGDLKHGGEVVIDVDPSSPRLSFAFKSAADQSRTETKQANDNAKTQKPAVLAI
jgi:ATP-dependent Clp protease ATP-binding subunit ClpA